VRSRSLPPVPVLPVLARWPWPWPPAAEIAAEADFIVTIFVFKKRHDGFHGVFEFILWVKPRATSPWHCVIFRYRA
jgi:hypothetical protein